MEVIWSSIVYKRLTHSWIWVLFTQGLGTKHESTPMYNYTDLKIYKAIQ